MVRQDVFTEIAAVLLPLPRRGDVPDDEWDETCDLVTRERDSLANDLRLAADELDRYDYDPLLSALREARRRRDNAELQIRRLLAYAREFHRPRTYRLTDLADASGLSISGVRTAYDDEEVADVADAIDALPHRDSRSEPEQSDAPHMGES